MIIMNSSPVRPEISGHFRRPLAPDDDNAWWARISNRLLATASLQQFQIAPCQQAIRGLASRPPETKEYTQLTCLAYLPLCSSPSAP